jgi:hypothetical protein
MSKRACAVMSAALGLAAFVSSASADILWDQTSPLATGTISRASGTAVPGPGVPAPAGSFWSELFIGNTSNGSTVSPSGTTGIFRLADNFTLSQASRVDTVTAIAYVTGSGDTLFNTGNIRIWNGVPDAPGSSVVFGDTTTDRLTSSALTNIYRIFSTDNSLQGGVNNVPGTTRRLKTAVFDIGGLNLPAGEYWVDYQMVNPLTPTGAVFHPYVTLTTARGAPGANALQLTTGPSTWVTVLDTGDPAANPDIAQELVFRVDGVVPEPATLGLIGVAGLGLLRRRR